MTKPLIQIGDEIREMNDAEYAQHQLDLTAWEAQAEAQAVALAAKTIARQALLEKLGITEEEAQLLLGGV